MSHEATAPLIGITLDNRENSAASDHYELRMTYVRAVIAAGGLAVALPHAPELAEAYLDRCDGVLLTGGVDPSTEAFGEPTHPDARPMDPGRQSFELALLDAAAAHSEKPMLGVCLGMQLMALHAGGRIDQSMPQSMGEAAAAKHQGDRRHGLKIEASDSAMCDGVAGSALAAETVVSYHRQAVSDPGRLRVVARAEDGVIEAIDDASRGFCVGVQWHPERGGDGALSLGLIERFVKRCGGATK